MGGGGTGSVPTFLSLAVSAQRQLGRMFRYQFRGPLGTRKKTGVETLGYPLPPTPKPHIIVPTRPHLPRDSGKGFGTPPGVWDPPLSSSYLNPDFWKRCT